MDARIINIDPEILDGTPVFLKTQLPTKNLFDHLKTGILLKFFLKTLRV